MQVTITQFNFINSYIIRGQIRSCPVRLVIKEQLVDSVVFHVVQITYTPDSELLQSNGILLLGKYRFALLWRGGGRGAPEAQQHRHVTSL